MRLVSLTMEKVIVISSESSESSDEGATVDEDREFGFKDATSSRKVKYYKTNSLCFGLHNLSFMVVVFSYLRATTK